MKKNIFLLISFFYLINLNAQVDRRIGAGQYQNGKKSNKVDVVEKSIEKLKKEIKIDGFQEAVIRNLIKENQEKSKNILEARSLDDLEKNTLLKELGEKFNLEIKKILTPEQILAYDKLISK